MWGVLSCDAHTTYTDSCHIFQKNLLIHHLCFLTPGFDKTHLKNWHDIHSHHKNHNHSI